MAIIAFLFVLLFFGGFRIKTHFFHSNLPYGLIFTHSLTELIHTVNNLGDF